MRANSTQKRRASASGHARLSQGARQQPAVAQTRVRHRIGALPLATGRLPLPPTRPHGSPVGSAASKTSTFRASSPIFPRTSTPRCCTFRPLVRELLASARRQLPRPSPTKGSIHVWDCRDVSWLALLSDANSHWHTVSRVFLLGQSHWPNLSSSYYVIYAPYTVHYLWKLIKPLTTEQTQQKVSFSKGVPDALVEALGSEDAVARMLERGETLREALKKNLNSSHKHLHAGVPQPPRVVRPEHEHEDGAAEQRAERGAADAGDDEAVVVVRVRRRRVQSAVAGAVAAAGRERGASTRRRP